MKRTTSVSVIEEAARIWGVDPAVIFRAHAETAHIVAACRYVFWLENIPLPPIRGLMWDRAGIVKACLAARAENQSYSAKVGALVWFAQTGMQEPPSASPLPKSKAAA